MLNKYKLIRIRMTYLDINEYLLLSLQPALSSPLLPSINFINMFLVNKLLRKEAAMFLMLPFFFNGIAFS